MCNRWHRHGAGIPALRRGPDPHCVHQFHLSHPHRAPHGGPHHSHLALPDGPR